MISIQYPSSYGREIHIFTSPCSRCLHEFQSSGRLDRSSCDPRSQPHPLIRYHYAFVYSRGGPSPQMRNLYRKRSKVQGQIRSNYLMSVRKHLFKAISQAKEDPTSTKEHRSKRCFILFTSLAALWLIHCFQVLQRDDPKVMENDKKPPPPKGTRSYSTSTRRRAQTQAMTNPQSAEVQPPGHIFGLPELPLPSTSNLKHRYDPVVEQVTNLMMKDGKKSVAQRVCPSVPLCLNDLCATYGTSFIEHLLILRLQRMAMILERLRTAPPPSADPKHPLVPGAPPTNHLPLHPILYLTLAIDSVAPLLRIRSQRGAAGGGVALQIPIPLNVRQRRRTSIMWILDAACKRRSNSSGRTMFADKVADELIAIVEGRSGVWDKRGGIHRLGVAARANLSFNNRGRR